MCVPRFAAAVSAPSREFSRAPPSLADGPLTEQQYISRLAHSGTTLEVNVPIGASGASFKAQYAWASQRGYYPDQPTKARRRAGIAFRVLRAMR